MVEKVKLEDSGRISEPDKKPSKRREIKIPLDLLMKSQRRNFSWKRFLLLILIFFIIGNLISAFTYSITPKIAVIPIDGTIVTGSSSNKNQIGSRDIIKILYELENDNTVKGIILDINSPGGSPVASEEISNAIIKLQNKKPVYSVINDIGASGAFWISTTTNKTYASKMSLVGSIGVTSAGLGFEELIEEYNITYRRQVAGKYKDMGTPFREPTNEEKTMLQEILDEIHLEFINHVAESRNLTVEEVTKYANGEIFLGSRALEIGFIDEIGNYDKTLKDMKNITTYEDALIVEYESNENLASLLGFDNLLKLPTSESLVQLK